MPLCPIEENRFFAVVIVDSEQRCISSIMVVGNIYNCWAHGFHTIYWYYGGRGWQRFKKEREVGAGRVLAGLSREDGMSGRWISDFYIWGQKCTMWSSSLRFFRIKSLYLILWYIVINTRKCMGDDNSDVRTCYWWWRKTAITESYQYHHLMV